MPVLAELKMLLHFDWVLGGTYAHSCVNFCECSDSTNPAITAPGESLPGAGDAGATTVTPDPSADAHDGAELAGAVEEVSVVDEPEPLAQPVTATSVAAPQASAAAATRERPVPVVLII